MTEEACAVHCLLGCLALNGPVWAQVAWLVLFTLGWAFGAAAVREKARQALVPGEGE